jgi:hypothetical protein
LRGTRQIRYRAPWNASWGFRRTFFKPDSGFWMTFMFQGRSSVSCKWQMFRTIKYQQNDRRCWKIRELIREDRRRTFADTVGISLPGDLNRKFEHARHCPLSLTNDQKQLHVNVCLELREKANEDLTFISRIVVGDKSSIYG